MSGKHEPTDPELIRFLRDELGESLPTGAALQFTGPLWLWRGNAKDGNPTKAAWHFLTIDGDVADAIRASSLGRSAAWGSVPIAVTIGGTSWQTSIFPEKSTKSYLLPIKASVRKAEKLAENTLVTVTLLC